MKLEILTPTLHNRKHFYQRLNYEIIRQIQLLGVSDYVEHTLQIDNGEMTTGAKRNDMIRNSEAEYICFFDCDDMPTDVYVKKQLDVAISGMDCGSLNGLYFCNGVYDRPFTHSIKYRSWYTERDGYRRCPNHLNAIKRNIALQVPFPDKTIGEDGVQSMALLESGLIKTEYEIKETLYLYYDRTK